VPLSFWCLFFGAFLKIWCSVPLDNDHGPDFVPNGPQLRQFLEGLASATAIIDPEGVLARDLPILTSRVMATQRQNQTIAMVWTALRQHFLCYERAMQVYLERPPTPSRSPAFSQTTTMQ
jgi:hypothetical protein